MTTSDKRYPFKSRKEIKAKILGDEAFARECAVILQQRTDERDAGRAPEGKPWGWMSSQKATASKLVEKLRSGMLSAAEETRLAKMVAGYSRQLAEHHRAEELRRRPELAEIARVFGVDAPAPSARRCNPEEAAPTEQQPKAANGTAEEQEGDDPRGRVAAVLAETPGLRSEELASRVGIATAYLGPILRAMVEERRVRKTGVGRGTRYFVR